MIETLGTAQGPGFRDPARCGLPGCGQPLHIIYTLSMSVLLGASADDLQLNPVVPDTMTWQVECQAGHVILGPLDTAAGGHDFGRCDGGGWPPDARYQSR